jgi:hypothetical protein
VQKELHRLDPIGDEHPLELVDLLEGAAPFGGGGEALDPSTSTRPYQERSKATIWPCRGRRSKKRCR